VFRTRGIHIRSDIHSPAATGEVPGGKVDESQLSVCKMDKVAKDKFAGSPGENGGG
jgi:hypothetical protein